MLHRVELNVDCEMRQWFKLENNDDSSMKHGRETVERRKGPTPT